MYGIRERFQRGDEVGKPHIGDKAERKLTETANKMAEGFKQAGKKIEQKLNG